MIFNACIAILILLATYWYAFKEGFFSGLIHLACVIVAGALAFAFWEPLALTMLGGGGMAEFAWGSSLLGIFCFALIALRIATNLLIPQRQNFPLCQPSIPCAGGVLPSPRTAASRPPRAPPPLPARMHRIPTFGQIATPARPYKSQVGGMPGEVGPGSPRKGGILGFSASVYWLS